MLPLQYKCSEFAIDSYAIIDFKEEQQIWQQN